LSDALAAAYANSPDLNAQRAATRAADENLPGALAGYRPTVAAQANDGIQQFNQSPPTGPVKTTTHPAGGGLTVSETLFNGNRTFNSVKQAKSKILQSREDLDAAEVTLLKNAVTAYMNVLRDTATLDLRQDNVHVLEQQLGQTRTRFQIGEVTLTDIYQAQTSLAQGRIDAATAYSNLQASIAGYQQVIGYVPKQLDAARPIESLLPHALDEALALGQSANPTIQSAVHAVDVAALAVNLAEGQLYPTVGVTGTVGQLYDYNDIVNQRLFQASLVGQLNVPIYEGGNVYAQARQAKELLGQAQLQVDVQRNQTRAAIISAWSAWQSTATQIAQARKEVSAAEGALNGVREEAKLGERTTLDVLNAQQALLNARLQLIEAQYARVLGSYIVLGAIGTLSAKTLGLSVARYDPTLHFNQVKDKWIGLRTPEGR
jgi:outer membrane protein